LRYVKLGPSQCSNHKSKVSSSVAAEKSGDVFDDGPPGPSPLDDSHDVEKKPRSSCLPIVFQPFPLASYGQVLAGEPEYHDVNGAEVAYLLPSDLSHVPEIRNIRTMMLKN
jgi:hypothetical protein